MGKAVCFAGHRESWENRGIEEKLRELILMLIQEGYTLFYVGQKGEFDRLAARLLREIRSKNNSVRIMRVVSYSEVMREKEDLFYEYVTPEIEEVYFKRQIIERNKWMVDQCDVLVCNVRRKRESGAYHTFRYAETKGKRIINLTGF